MQRLLFSTLFFCLLATSCANPYQNNVKYQTAEKFIQFAKANDPNGIKNLIYPEMRISQDDVGIAHYTRLANKLVEKYGVPDQKKWLVTYDTATIFKVENITIPLFEGDDQDTRLKEGWITLSFDYTGKFVPNSQIVSYDVHAKYGKRR